MIYIEKKSNLRFAGAAGRGNPVCPAFYEEVNLQRPFQDLNYVVALEVGSESNQKRLCGIKEN